MAKTSAKKISNEIEFNERRLLLLLSNDLLWFKKNLVNIKTHKNRKAFYKKKTERYNQIFKTTQELSALHDKFTKTDSEILTNPYVYLEQEKLVAQKVKIKDGVKVKNLSKPKLFEVLTFTHFVDLSNNPKSRKYPKQKCVQIVQHKILDKNNNMPSSIIARDFYLKNSEEAGNIINNMYIESALYLKKDMELEMQLKNNKKKAKEQEQAIERHKKLTKTADKKQAKSTKKAIYKNTKTPKAKFNSITKTFEADFEKENELNF